MKLHTAAHAAMPWRVHDFTDDFEVEDVWAFRTPGAGPDDFPVMLAAMRSAGRITQMAWPARALFAARWKLGALFGWDRPSSAVGARVTSLRARLPSDIPAGGGDSEDLPLKSVYELPTESARELANRTVHTVMHLGWAETATGYELRMAVLVKPNGRFGRAYMAAIAPLRYLVVYPALTRRWERAWRDRATAPPAENGGTA